MTMSAAWQYDNGKPCGAAANAAKYLAGEAGFDACQQAVMTHGGYGYAKEYHVERYLREVMIPRIAPISPQLVLCFIAERVLGLASKASRRAAKAMNTAFRRPSAPSNGASPRSPTRWPG
jgi:alkylation response protein AidB-like acyl-CoA dehydrogenase